MLKVYLFIFILMSTGAALAAPVTYLSNSCDSSLTLPATSTTFVTSPRYTGSGSCRGSAPNVWHSATLASSIPASNVRIKFAIKFDNSHQASNRFQAPRLLLSNGSTVTLTTQYINTNLGVGASGSTQWRSRGYQYDFTTVSGLTITAVQFSTKRNATFYYEDLLLTAESLSTNFILPKTAQALTTNFSSDDYADGVVKTTSFLMNARINNGETILIKSSNTAGNQFLYLDCQTVTITGITNASPTGMVTLTPACRTEWNTPTLAPFVEITNNSGRDLLSVDFNLNINFVLQIADDITSGVTTEVFSLTN